MTVNRIFAVAGSVAALMAVLAGLYLSGPPSEQRLRRVDEQRVQGLRTLAIAIDAYSIANGQLPQSLEQAIETQRLRNSPADPVRGDPYEYELAEANQYRLCATFDRASQESRSPDFWEHESGRQCFTISPRPTRPAILPGPIR